jgi:hypothetical protein
MISDWWFALHAEPACCSLLTNCIQQPFNLSELCYIRQISLVVFIMEKENRARFLKNKLEATVGRGYSR